MKRLIVLAAILSVLLAATPVPAQEPGSGGTIVVGSGIATTALGSLNPLRGSLTNYLVNLMFPSIVGVSPFTQYYGRAGEKGVFNALATDWTVSADGLTYTFTLRRDAVWSDGIPITATDVKFSFDAIASGEIETLWEADWNPVYDRIANPSGIREIVVVDDYTVQAMFEEANCDSLRWPSALFVIPAHIFGYDGQPDFDFSVMVGHPFDTYPSVVYGPWQLDYIHLGEELALKPVLTWADGLVIPAGLVFRDVLDPEDATRRFLAEEFDYIEIPPYCLSCSAEVRAAQDVTAVSFPSPSWDYVGLNLADPDDPQPGEDAQGNRIDQGHHPLFGDVRVRRALQHAINVPAIIERAVFGEGTQMASAILPTSWAADPTLEPVPHDPALAAQMLDDAGWPLGPNGVRVCQGCKYALDGTPFEFELVTTGGNTRREATGAMIREQLAALGIVVEFHAIAFEDLLRVMRSQDFDAYLIGWAEGVPHDPDRLWLFGPGEDALADALAFNDGSYYNPEFVRLSRQAFTLPGCDPAQRAAIYHQIERLLQEDQPYLWLFTLNNLYAAHTNVVGFDPQPNMGAWNHTTWQVPGR